LRREQYLLPGQVSIILLVILADVDELHVFEIGDLDSARCSPGGELN
jgi:hypothetical protein